LDTIFETADLATAAFLLMKKFKLNSASVLNGKYHFIFSDPNCEASITCLEFVNSECASYDSCVRSLRGMLRDSRK